jgi:16S rRNA (uracil1498-N3)-methyltransferase
VTRRVFHDTAPLETGRVVTLSAEEAHYLLRVRRGAVGDAVEVLDGRGGHVRGEIVAAQGSRCDVRLGEAIAAAPCMPLVLLLGLPDAKAALDAITLATEVGATTIVLVRCARSQPAEPSPARIDRTIRAALRQCGRAAPPQIVGPLGLGDALSRPDPRPGWVADARTRATPTDLAVGDPEAGTTILVGPEGGLTAEEVTRAGEAGLFSLSLGPFVLRTPTAVCAALSRAVAAAARSGAS